MSEYPFSLADTVLVVSTFGMVLALWGLGVLVWRRKRAAEARKIAERLNPDLDEGKSTRVLRLWREGHEATTTVPEKVNWQSLESRISRLCCDAGWHIPTSTLLLGAAGGASLVLMFSLVLTKSLLPGAGVALGLATVLWIYLKQRISSRTALFERLFVDALEIAVRSLRAGHPLTGAMRLVSEEIAAPVGPLFGEICQQQELGMSLQQAVVAAAESSSSPDMRLFATSVVIQLQTGGNLADMMERLSEVIRGRMRLHRRVRVLLAQVQTSKRVLMALPFVLFIILNIVNPGYMESLYTTGTGRVLLTAGAVCLLVGVWLMNRLAALKY